MDLKTSTTDPSVKAVFSTLKISLSASRFKLGFLTTISTSDSDSASISSIMFRVVSLVVPIQSMNLATVQMKEKLRMQEISEGPSEI